MPTRAGGLGGGGARLGCGGVFCRLGVYIWAGDIWGARRHAGQHMNNVNGGTAHHAAGVIDNTDGT